MEENTRQFGQYTFNHITSINPQSDDDGVVKIFMPQNSFKNHRGLSLHVYGAGPFCDFRIPKTYKMSGVYIITLDHQPFYVGECVNLSKRFNTGYGLISPRNCFQDGQSTNCRINNLIYQASLSGTQIDLWFHPTDDYKSVEAELIANLESRDRWNRKN